MYIEDALRIYHGRYFEGHEIDPLDYTRVIDHADLGCVGIDAPFHFLDCIPPKREDFTYLDWIQPIRDRFFYRLAVAKPGDEFIIVLRLFFALNLDVTNADYGKYTCILRQGTPAPSLSINVTGGNY